MMKMARECLQRGHRVRVYTMKWDGETEPALELIKVPVSAVTNHERYARYATWVLDHESRHPVDLLVGMNKMPGLDVYYAGDSCFEEKAREQRGSLYRSLPRYHHFAKSEAAVFRPEAATELLTISDVEVPMFRKHYQTPPERFHRLPPGIERDRVVQGRDAAELASDRAALRGELGLAADEQLLLFVGSGFIKKGLDRALLGLQALPPEQLARTRLCIIGKDNVDPFRRMAKRLGVFDRLIIFDEGRADLPRFLFSADALVLPAYDEAAGMVILESMVAGLPVLATANCGYASYLREHQAGLISEVPFVQDDFNAQLRELLTSSERDTWSVNGTALAADESIYGLTSKAVDYLEQFAAAKPITIAFTLFKYFPYGGLQRDFIKVARACVAAGHRVRVYTLSWDADIEKGIDVQIVSVGGLVNHARYQRYATKVAEHLTWFPVDVVVGYNKMPGLDIYYAADACYEQKAQEMRGAMYRASNRYRFFSRFERAVFTPEAHTQIFLIAEDQRTQFQKYYQTPDARLELLPPNVSADRARGADWQQVRAEFRQHYKLADDDFLLLLVGSGFITKGVDRVLLALASLSGPLLSRCYLHVVGEDNPKPFQSMADELGLESRVTFFAGRDDIPRFLQGADLVVHPAYMESGGIVLLESLIAGLPLITTANCGFSSYVADSGGGRVLPEPFDQQHLNQALAELLQDPAARARMSEAGLAFGASADLNSMAGRMLSAIESFARPPIEGGLGSKTSTEVSTDEASRARTLSSR